MIAIAHPVVLILEIVELIVGAVVEIVGEVVEIVGEVVEIVAEVVEIVWGDVSFKKLIQRRLPYPEMPSIKKIELFNPSS